MVRRDDAVRRNRDRLLLLLLIGINIVEVEEVVLRGCGEGQKAAAAAFLRGASPGWQPQEGTRHDLVLVRAPPSPSIPRWVVPLLLLLLLRGEDIVTLRREGGAGGTGCQRGGRYV